jgi:hypothetical protein
LGRNPGGGGGERAVCSASLSRGVEKVACNVFFSMLVSQKSNILAT